MAEWVIIEFYNSSNVLIGTVKIDCFKAYCCRETLDIPEGTTSAVVKIRDGGDAEFKSSGEDSSEESGEDQ